MWAQLVLFLSCVFVVQGKSSCRSVDDTPGHCILFKHCPRLLQLLHSSSITSENLHLLQRLTCEIKNHHEPKVCCPLASTSSTIEIEDSWTESIRLPDNKTKVTLPLTPSVTITPKPFIPEPQKNIEIDLRKHPNFHLIPELSKCSRIGSDTDRIVGGKNVKHGGLPWMARIGYRHVDSNPGDEPEFYCGGTVINSRYILTAAHCTEEIDADYTPTIVRLAEHNVSTVNDCSALGCSKVMDYPIERIIPHEEYNTDTNGNDIGLIRVDREITFDTPYIKPVCLPFIDEYEIKKFFPKNITSRKGTVAGWGKVKWNRAEGSQSLLEVIIPFISNEECEAKYGNKIPVTQKQLCAGGIYKKDSCGGDSGGPIMALSRTSQRSPFKYFQLGVVSFGPVQCGQGGLPGVYSRLTSYLKWILDTIEP